MGTYCLDTSAIVKRYFPEQGHHWVVALCDPKQEHDLYISQAALVEVVATICRKAREQKIADEQRDQLIRAFRQDCESDYVILPVTTAIYTAAGNLCRAHRLRAYDAVQLACALSLRGEAAVNEDSKLIFVCADNNLLNIVSIEGLNTQNPNSYP